MKHTTTTHRRFTRLLGLMLLAAGLVAPALVQAQDRPPQRQIRTYIPPDQLVSFLPSTPFNQFVEFLNPIVQRVTGKQVIDPESLSDPIGISIAGMHFLDAFELVLNYNGLGYRETDQFFIVQPALQEVVTPTGEVVAVSSRPAGLADLPATAATREIQINALLFEVNVSQARDIGLDWSAVFGQGGGSGGSGNGSSGGNSGGSGGANGSSGGLNFSLKTDEFFPDEVKDYVKVPELTSFADLASFFRLLEDEGIGETVANPQVTVVSGEQGQIQIGSDIPVQTRDFAGNTVTQFFKTGIIIDVLPTLITEDLDESEEIEELIDFIHLNVVVENSSGRPSTAGVVIDRNTANTKVLLLDGEQTVIGGLYSTQESRDRRGIPVLKDLPNWFFGLGYIFGRTVTTTVQKEMLIVLQAEVLDPLPVRAQQAGDRDLLEERRRKVQETIGRFSPQIERQTMLPEPGSKH